MGFLAHPNSGFGPGVRFPGRLTPRGKLAEFLLALLVGSALGALVVFSTNVLDNKWKLVLGMVGGAAFILVTVRWPEYGVLGLLALTNGLVSINWLPLLSFGPFSLHIQDIVLGILLALLGVKAALKRDFRLAFSPLMIPLVLFLGAVILSVINGYYVHHLDLNVVMRRGRSVILWAAFFPAFGLIRDRASVNRFVQGLWFLTGVLAAGVVLHQLAPSVLPFIFPTTIEDLTTLGTEISGVGRVFQYQGGDVLYAMIPVTFATLAMAGRERLRPLQAALLTLVLVLEMNWLVRSFQRSLWITTTLSFFILFTLTPLGDRARLLRRLAPLVAAVLLALAVYSQLYPAHFNRLTYGVADRFASLHTDLARTDNSVQWRLVENRYAMANIRRSPVFGIGLGSDYRPPFETEIWWNEPRLRWFIHNAYLWMAVMMGLAALIPFVALCVLYLARGLTSWRKIDDVLWRAIVLGLALSFGGQVINNITEPAFLDGSSQSAFPILMALSERILVLARAERRGS